LTFEVSCNVISYLIIQHGRYALIFDLWAYINASNQFTVFWWLDTTPLGPHGPVHRFQCDAQSHAVDSIECRAVPNVFIFRQRNPRLRRWTTLFGWLISALKDTVRKKVKVKAAVLKAIVSFTPGSIYDRIISFRAPYHDVTVVFYYRRTIVLKLMLHK